MGDVCHFLNGYAFKSKSLDKEKKAGAFPIFKMGNIMRGGGFKPESKTFGSKVENTVIEKYLLDKGDILIAMTDMKSSMALLGHTALMPWSNKYLLNQRVGKINSKDSSILDYPYLYVWSNQKNTIEDLRSRANSGVQVNLSTVEIKSSKLLIPSTNIHRIFNDFSKPLFEIVGKNQLENQTLSSLRDALLPKLLSGELRVDEVEGII